MRSTLRRLLPAVLTAIGLGAASLSIAHAAVPPPTPGPLTKYSISSTYVSGLSSGGYMANQLHVAYSGIFQGAGIVSAGPYDCADGSLATALNACMDTYMARRTPEQLVQLTRNRASAGVLDPVQNLSDDRVWLLHGGADQTIDRVVNDDLATYYRALGANVAYNTSLQAGHAWISPIGPNACATTQSPYVNKCGTGDPVGEMLRHLFGAVNPAASSVSGKLIQFDQNDYVPGGSAASISMGPTASPTCPGRARAPPAG